MTGTSSKQPLAELLSESPSGLSVSVYSIDVKPSEAGLTLEIDCSVEGSRSLSVVCQQVAQFSAPQVSEFAGTLQQYTEHPYLFSFGPQASIFGNAPLPDPQRFFFDFYQLVRQELGSEVDPALYLNGRADLKQWLEFVYSRMYRLLTAPASIVELTRDLLDAQAAEYTVLPDEKPDADPETATDPAKQSLCVVEVGPLRIVCAEAHGWFV